MEKSYIEFQGKQYPVREVDLSPILDGYGTETIAGCELSAALQDAEVTEIDNSIYCYLDSGMMDADLTDSEILMEIVRMECLQLSDQEWYNLMRLAALEIGIAKERGAINGCVECYEMGGEYTAYTYGDGYNIQLYRGKSAETCCMVMMAAVTLFARNNQHFYDTIKSYYNE